MASACESGRFSPNEKIPVQCLDDPFGMEAEVIYGDESFLLYRCTPFLTIYRTQHMPIIYSNERFNAETEDPPETRQQMHDMPNADNQEQPNATPLTDGGSPLAMAMGGLGNYKPQKKESLGLLEEEVWDNHPRLKLKKVGKRRGKKTHRKRRQ